MTDYAVVDPDVPDAEETAYQSAPPVHASHPDDSVKDHAQSLIAAGRSAVAAELSLLRTQAEVAAVGTKTAGVYAGLALAGGIVTLLTFAIGMILSLTPYITAPAATLLVVGLLAIFTVFAAMRARSGGALVAQALRRNPKEGDV